MDFVWKPSVDTALVCFSTVRDDFSYHSLNPWSTCSAQHCCPHPRIFFDGHHGRRGNLPYFYRYFCIFCFYSFHAGQFCLYLRVLSIFGLVLTWMEIETAISSANISENHRKNYGLHSSYLYKYLYLWPDLYMYFFWLCFFMVVICQCTQISRPWNWQGLHQSSQQVAILFKKLIYLVATSTPFLWIKLIQFQDVEAIYDDLALLKKDVTEMKNGNMSELISINHITNDVDIPSFEILSHRPSAWNHPGLGATTMDRASSNSSWAPAWGLAALE